MYTGTDTHRRLRYEESSADCCAYTTRVQSYAASRAWTAIPLLFSGGTQAGGNETAILLASAVTPGHRRGTRRERTWSRLPHVTHA